MGNLNVNRLLGGLILFGLTWLFVHLDEPMKDIAFVLTLGTFAYRELRGKNTK